MYRIVLALAATIGVSGSVLGEETAQQDAKIQYGLKSNLFYLPKAEAEVTPYEREKCRLDVYYPENRPGFATVVWFHGGGLSGGSRGVPEPLKDKGIALVGAGYRLSPQVTSPVYIQDAAAAVAWVFHHIHEFGGDPKKIFVAGLSAGGYLTSMIGLDKRWLAAHAIDANQIAGLIPVSGHTITHLTIRRERGIAETRPIVDDLAPLYHVRPDAPPILLITGDRELEMLGRYEENAYLMRMLKVAGHKNVTLIELPGLGHGDLDERAFGPAREWIETVLKNQ